MATKINRLSRQKSLMVVETNPLEAARPMKFEHLKIENLNHASVIKPEELKTLVTDITKIETNEGILKYLEEHKGPYLFTSECLSQIVDITTSVKTKIAIITMLGPRLTDPKAKLDYFTGLFRFVEEKSVVEEVLKHRAHILATSIFTKASMSPSHHNLNSIGSPGGRTGILLGGRGGRGTGGRGHPPTGGRSVGLPHSTVTHPEIEKDVTSCESSSNSNSSTPPSGATIGLLGPRRPTNLSAAHHDRLIRELAASSDDSLDLDRLGQTVFGFDAVLATLRSSSIDLNGRTKSMASLATIQEFSDSDSEKEIDGEEDVKVLQTADNINQQWS